MSKYEVEVKSYPKGKSKEMVNEQPRKQLDIENPSSKQQLCIQFHMLFSSNL